MTIVMIPDFRMPRAMPFWFVSLTCFLAASPLDAAVLAQAPAATDQFSRIGFYTMLGYGLIEIIKRYMDMKALRAELDGMRAAAAHAKTEAEAAKADALLAKNDAASAKSEMERLKSLLASVAEPAAPQSSAQSVATEMERMKATLAKAADPLPELPVAPVVVDVVHVEPETPR